jgi:hypothetical protein
MKVVCSYLLYPLQTEEAISENPSIFAPDVRESSKNLMSLILNPSLNKVNKKPASAHNPQTHQSN